MKRHNRIRRILAALVVPAAVVAGTSCAVDPDAVPIPGTRISGGYHLTFQFISAMNLPDRANVMLDGLRVGQVDSIGLGDHMVNVSARITPGTRIPSGITAVIRQDTLLGDTYLALEPGPDDAVSGDLPDGAVVPLSRTTSPPQLEDVMAVLANFVNGGSIQKIQNSIMRINTVMPPAPQVGKLASTVSTDVQNLAAHNTEIDRMLTQLDDTARTADANGPALSTMLSDSSVHYWYRLNDGVTRYVGTLLPSIGSIFQGGIWLVPLLTSLASDATSIRSTAENVPSDLTSMSDLINHTVVPFLRNPSVNVQSVRAADGTDLTPAIENVLRMLGAVR